MQGNVHSTNNPLIYDFKSLARYIYVWVNINRP